MWDSGTGRTHGTDHVGWDTRESLGQSLQSHVGQWDGTDTWDRPSRRGTQESLGQSIQFHVGQWDGTDTWDRPCMMGHMGVPRTVHVGQWDRMDTWDRPCRVGHMGVPRTVPQVPCGTGRTHDTSHVGWDTWESLGHPSLNLEGPEM